ncbi:MAG: membrane-binding protein [Bacteroidetes bacterium]|nr:membrane-binding protein [Bacteroidota bacterium]
MNRVLAFGIIALLASCRQSKVPAVFVNASAEKIITREGVTYRSNEIFSGWAFTLNAAGDTTSLTPYLDGKEEGILKLWYDNRQLKEVRVYHQGKKEGEHKGWYADGTPRLVYHYKNDVYHGNVTEWQANGKLYRDFNYENGYESGTQKMWEADGRLKANYQVRNGRKYGLTGSKNCLSASR